MVESKQIDALFMALSDGTRRSILARVAEKELSIGEIAEHYQLTFAAISKHIQVLQKANLIKKYRRGKEQIVVIAPDTLAIAQEQIEQYAHLWHERFNNLDTILKET